MDRTTAVDVSKSASVPTLKDRLENVLSFDIQMFPMLPSLVETAIRAYLNLDETEANERWLDTAIDSTLSASPRLSLVTSDDEKDIRTRIDAYNISRASGVNARSGGSNLLKSLDKLYNSKADILDKWLPEIHAILNPVATTRTTIADVKAQAERDAIARTATTFKLMDEKSLRAFATVMIGEDIQADYPRDALPLLIATFQMTGTVTEEGRIV